MGCFFGSGSASGAVTYEDGDSPYYAAFDGSGVGVAASPMIDILALTFTPDASLHVVQIATAAASAPSDMTTAIHYEVILDTPRYERAEAYAVVEGGEVAYAGLWVMNGTFSGFVTIEATLRDEGGIVLALPVSVLGAEAWVGYARARLSICPGPACLSGTTVIADRIPDAGTFSRP